MARSEVDGPALERALKRNREVTDALDRMGAAIAQDAKQNATALGLVKTGRGVKSIDHEVGFDEDGSYARVSWGKREFYMRFHEFGTSHENAKPFLRPAAEKKRDL